MSTKILKPLNYVERCKMFISRMQSSNWITIEDTNKLTKLKFNLDEDLWKTTLESKDWISFAQAEEKRNMYQLGEVVEPNDSIMLALLGTVPVDLNSEDPEKHNNCLILEYCEPMDYYTVALYKDFMGEHMETFIIYFHGDEELGMKEGFQDEFLAEVDSEGNLDLSKILDGVFYSANVENGNLFDNYINGILIGE